MMTPHPTTESDLPAAKAAAYVRMSTEHQQYAESEAKER